MRKVTIQRLLAHKLRLALTALAIVLGVTFISGTFVLTDTLQNTFNTLFGNIYAKVDFQVRGVAQLGSGAGEAEMAGGRLEGGDVHLGVLGDPLGQLLLTDEDFVNIAAYVTSSQPE